MAVAGLSPASRRRAPRHAGHEFLAWIHGGHDALAAGPRSAQRPGIGSAGQ